MSHPDGTFASQARDEDCFYLLDYFAAKVMTKYLCNENYNQNPSEIAKMSYDMAEKMLIERDKRNNENKTKI